tara:strand:+ start:170 stop:355 length:186 start_codon:yes stop_codon:yes gene_type:complete
MAEREKRAGTAEATVRSSEAAVSSKEKTSPRRQRMMMERRKQKAQGTRSEHVPLSSLGPLA